MKMEFIVACEMQDDGGDQHSIVQDFADEVHERFKKPTQATMFLEGGVGCFELGKRMYMVTRLRILFPRFWLYSIMGTVLLWLLLGFGWWVITMALISCLGLFWTKYPYQLMIKKALRKKGFDGKVCLL